MTNEEAKAIIRKEYLCVDRDCDIERSCGRCDLMMPSKEPILEAFRMAMDLLEQNATTKDCLGVDLISRQAVLDMAFDMSEIDGEHFEDKYMVVEVDNIRQLPSVNPTKTGYWIHDGSHWKNRWICSKCGYKLIDVQSNFCPNCGARMERAE